MFKRPEIFTNVIEPFLIFWKLFAILGEAGLKTSQEHNTNIGVLFLCGNLIDLRIIALWGCAILYLHAVKIYSRDAEG